MYVSKTVKNKNYDKFELPSGIKFWRLEKQRSHWR